QQFPQGQVLAGFQTGDLPKREEEAGAGPIPRPREVNDAPGRPANPVSPLAHATLEDQKNHPAAKQGEQGELPKASAPQPIRHAKPLPGNLNSMSIKDLQSYA